jgi:Protein of unknown function (DUF1425)
MNRTSNVISHAKPMLAAALLGVALLSAPGCTDPNAPIEARGERYGQPWLTLGSRNLRSSIMVGDASVVRDRETGILKVAVPVRSTSDKQQYIQYRMTFVDGAGMQINDVNGTVTIPARGSQTIAANGTSDRAESFRLLLTYPRVN